MSSHYVPNTKTPTLVFPSNTQASRHLALMIESLIRQNNSAGRPTVLGLPTGSTPVGLYRELIRLHKDAGLDFSRVVTFNLDEYYPMRPDDPHSYCRWMHETFFEHVNIAPKNIHIPDATFLLDESAASALVSLSRPWAVGPVEWTPALIRRAVIWLSLRVGKALLLLSDDDFREHELYELLREHGPAEQLGRLVFDQMM